MNRREWVLYGQKELEEAQIENASGDAWYLFSECFHISREDYLFGMTDEINDKEAEERYKELIQKRKRTCSTAIYFRNTGIYGIYI